MQHSETLAEKPGTIHRDILAITLDDALIKRRSPEVESEREVAMRDLIVQNQFRPESGISGPFSLFLSVREQRLSFALTGKDGVDETLALPLAPLRGVIKDYFLICESYFAAIPHASADKVQTLDMARRGIHNEGASLLAQQLKGKASLDFDTARRLFTLICVLHLK